MACIFHTQAAYLRLIREILGEISEDREHGKVCLT